MTYYLEKTAITYCLKTRCSVHGDREQETASLVNVATSSRTAPAPQP